VQVLPAICDLLPIYGASLSWETDPADRVHAAAGRRHSTAVGLAVYTDFASHRHEGAKIAKARKMTFGLRDGAS
jgi:hypothetical protein